MKQSELEKLNERLIFLNEKSMIVLPQAREYILLEMIRVKNQIEKLKEKE